MTAVRSWGLAARTASIGACTNSCVNSSRLFCSTRRSWSPSVSGGISHSPSSRPTSAMAFSRSARRMNCVAFQNASINGRMLNPRTRANSRLASGDMILRKVPTHATTSCTAALLPDTMDTTSAEAAYPSSSTLAMAVSSASPRRMSVRSASQAPGALLSRHMRRRAAVSRGKTGAPAASRASSQILESTSTSASASVTRGATRPFRRVARRGGWTPPAEQVSSSELRALSVASGERWWWWWWWSMANISILSPAAAVLARRRRALLRGVCSNVTSRRTNSRPSWAAGSPRS